MPAEERLRFFLGANSPGGFYSLYSHLIEPETAEEVYILKGGPGCGKSTFMQKTALRLEEAGVAAEYIHCSSDPSSLDAVIFPSIGTAIVDGTSPHVVEPVYPYAVETYLNLGEFCDTGAVRKKKSELIDAYKRYRACFDGVYRHISAARIIGDEMFNTILNSHSLDKIKKRARGVIRREIRGKGSGASVTKRFLSGITPDGILCFYDTASALCERVFEVNDSFGLGHFFLSQIMEDALQSSFRVYACMSPLNPETQIEHLFIPELSLGFVSTNPRSEFTIEPFRRIRLDASIPVGLLRENRQRLRFERRTSAALLDESVASLKAAKSIHDEIEELCNPHIDFDGILKASDSLSDSLLSRI